MLPFMMKAAVATLKKFPEFNASLDGDALVLKNYWHIGFAADTPNGLMVPVIRDADKKTVPEIAKEMGELAKLARDGKLKPDQMQGGTFTISSLGGIGGIYFTPIINAPEVVDHGRVQELLEAALQRRQDLELAADAAAVAVVGPPRDRRRRRRALQRAFRQRARRPAARAVLKGARAMAQLVEVKVPDIGDFKDVAVIEVMVKPGETIAVDTGLIMVESDKASMEIPSTHAGVVKELKVKLGDKVSEGSVILVVEAAGGRRARAGAGRDCAAAAAAAAAPAPAGPTAGSYAGKADIECEMLVLGAGPGGYSAAFRSADLGMKTVLVERYATLGGVCLNVGCIPSKALLHTAAVMDEVEDLPATTASSTARRRSTSTSCAASRTAWSRSSPAAWPAWPRRARSRCVTGVGSFLDPHHLEVVGADGGKKVVKFAKAIIAAGSQAVKLPFMPEDERVVDSTGALLLKSIPKRMLVVGGGIIGLEMATVYSTLGTRIDVVEMLDGLMQGADRDLVKVWEKMNARALRQGDAEDQDRRREGHARPASRSASRARRRPKEPQIYDLVLVAVGRSPNGKQDRRRQGRRRRHRPRLHRGRQADAHQRAAHLRDRRHRRPADAGAQGGARGACGGRGGARRAGVLRRAPDSRRWPTPTPRWPGPARPRSECKAEGIKFGKAVFPWAASGRAIANGRDEGFTKLIFDEATHRVIGGGIVGTHAGDLISEVCLAIEMGCEPADIGKTIHPHPTLGESIGMAPRSSRASAPTCRRRRRSRRADAWH